MVIFAACKSNDNKINNIEHIEVIKRYDFKDGNTVNMNASKFKKRLLRNQDTISAIRNAINNRTHTDIYKIMLPNRVVVNDTITYFFSNDFSVFREGSSYYRIDNSLLNSLFDSIYSEQSN